jgi:hypothetical protein
MLKNKICSYAYWGQHQNRFFHFSQSVSRDSQDFTTTTHQIWKKGDVTTINTHAVAFHGELNFFSNRCSELIISSINNLFVLFIKIKKWITYLAASIPKVLETSKILFDVVEHPLTP